jgi:hypothetical protein
MGTRQKTNEYVIPSRTSPKGGSRGCLCADNTYHKDCCDGSIMAQGIGVIQRVKPIVVNSFLLQENGDDILQENNDKIIL